MTSKYDAAAAQELELYTENTFQIYDRHTMPTVESLKQKHSKGQYDKGKAVKAWEYVAEAAAKLYAKEFANPAQWYTIFSKATRRKVAEVLESVYFEEYIA